jgi:hypothetical protein
VGQQAILSLRPEAVRLLGEHETADNVAAAEIVERIFLGRQVRFTLHALGQTMVAIGSSPIGVTGPGQRVRIGWSAGSGQILSHPA